VIKSDVIEEIRKEARGYFKDSGGSHGWDHVERVYNLALHIGKKEKADLDVVVISALLHDIAREKQDRSKGQICHAEEGSKLAEKILYKYNLKADFIENVAHSIAAHRYRKNIQPRTLEARVLRDADRLDGIGAVGIGRAFMFAGEVGSKLHNPEIAGELLKDRSYTDEDTAYQEYLFKLRKIGSTILTNEGKRIAKERLEFMDNFFETLNREYKGFE
jgi:uncharacterized protein